MRFVNVVKKSYSIEWISTGITGTEVKTFRSSGNVSVVGNIKTSLSKFFGTPILSGALFWLVQAVTNIKKTISIAIANKGI